VSSTSAHPFAGFGANEWLVDEMYQQFLKDPSSVDKAWWDFFSDYSSGNGGSAEGGGPGAAVASSSSGTAAPAAPAAPAPAVEPASRPAPAAPQQAAASQPAPTQPTAAASTAKPEPASQPVTQQADQTSPLKGAAARTVANMEASLAIPTATSVRDIPAKLLADNRLVMNNHLKRGRGGKLSFTHIIGVAVVQAAAALPEMNASYTEINGKPGIVHHSDINLGLAIDMTKDDGTRQLLVPCIKGAQSLDFAQFYAAYEDIVRRARANKLTADDFVGTTITLTNPGTLGTVHSVPRLMPGQGCIVGVGAMEYPAQFHGASTETLAQLAVSKVMTLTSTYDHRVIQGAQSGDFLRQIHRLLLGENGFYDDLFRALRIPYEPVRWVQDVVATHDDEVGKPARVIELIHAYRVRGHLMADTNPLEFEMRRHPDLDIVNHGLTLWDLDREFATGGFGGKQVMTLREILGVLRDSYCRTIGVEYMHIQDPEQRKWIQDRVERSHSKPSRDEQRYLLYRLTVAEAFETFLQTTYVGQ
jgi:2-oxoglutarate dehydrogenase E1 component